MYGMIILTLVAITIADSHAGCPQGFEEFNYSCYIFGQTAVSSYNNAFYTCFNKGGYLVNINAEIENKYVIEKLQKQNNVLNGWWTGGSYNGQYWVWQKTSQGTVVPVPMDPDGFSDWGRYQVENRFVRDAKTAIMKNGVFTPYKWYAFNTWSVPVLGMSYICEADYKLP